MLKASNEIFLWFNFSFFYKPGYILDQDDPEINVLFPQSLSLNLLCELNFRLQTANRRNCQNDLNIKQTVKKVLAFQIQYYYILFQIQYYYILFQIQYYYILFQIE